MGEERDYSTFQKSMTASLLSSPSIHSNDNVNMELETDRLTCFAIAQSNTVYSETHQSYLAHYLSRAQYASWQLLIFALYIAVGMVIYILIEHWTAIQALYFCIVSVTTVGYGDVVPKSDAGKLFTVFYVFVGVFIVCSFFYKGLENLLEKHEKRFLQSLVSSDDMNTAIQQQQKAVSSHKNLLWTISITVIVVAVFLVVGALVLILMGEGSFIDGLYFASMTLTTVGYGDYTFDQKYARLFSVFYIITGVLLVGYQINAVTTAMVGVSGTDSELARVLCDLDLDLLQSMDENSDGRVTWGEFLENTLIASDILSQDQIDDINSRYKQLLKQQGSHRTRTAANNLTVEQRLNRIHSHTQHYDRRRVQGKEKKRAGPEEDGTGIDLRTILSSE